MAVSIKVKNNYYDIGSGDLLISFFDTICYNLENNKRGSVFPTISINFYNGYVDSKDLKKFKKELRKIKRKLSKLSLDKLVWDINDKTNQPPWGDNISSDIKSLSDYYITEDGISFFEVINNAIEYAIENNLPIEIK